MAQRCKHTGQFKARVAIEAIAGHKTVNEISSEYGVHASQIHTWKRQALAHLPEVLDDHRRSRRDTQEILESRLYGYYLKDLTFWSNKPGVPQSWRNLQPVISHTVNCPRGCC